MLGRLPVGGRPAREEAEERSPHLHHGAQGGPPGGVRQQEAAPIEYSHIL